jgi:hypothetical protein
MFPLRATGPCPDCSPTLASRLHDMLGWIGLGTAGAALTAANVRSTVRLWKCDAFERPQKIAQTVLLWTIPGAFAVVSHFVSDAEGKARSPGHDWSSENAHTSVEVSEHSHHSHGHGGDQGDW